MNNQLRRGWTLAVLMGVLLVSDAANAISMRWGLATLDASGTWPTAEDLNYSGEASLWRGTPYVRSSRCWKASTANSFTARRLICGRRCWVVSETRSSMGRSQSAGRNRRTHCGNGVDTAARERSISIVTAI